MLFCHSRRFPLRKFPHPACITPPLTNTNGTKSPHIYSSSAVKATQFYSTHPSPRNHTFKVSNDSSTSKSQTNGQQEKPTRKNQLFSVLAIFGASSLILYTLFYQTDCPVFFTSPLTAMMGCNEKLFIAKQLFPALPRYPFPSNLLIAKLSNGDVLVYNAVFVTPELKEQLQTLLKEQAAACNLSNPDQVKLHIIVPNNQHNFFYNSWRESFTNQCCVYIRDSNKNGLKRLEKSLERNQLGDANESSSSSHTGVVLLHKPDDFPECIRQDFDVRFLNGLKMVDEICLLHRSSKTLVCCDLAQHITNSTYPIGVSQPQSMKWFTRNSASRAGNQNHIAAAGEFKYFTFKNESKDEFQASVEEICLWDFDGAFLSHGECISPNVGASWNLPATLKEDYDCKVFGGGVTEND